MISYEKLWLLFREKNIPKKALKEDIHLSSATIAQIYDNQPISIRSIMAICKYLNCDIGDVVSLSTKKEDKENATLDYIWQLNSPNITESAVMLYIQKNNISQNVFVKRTGISANTLRRIINLQSIKISTYKKLFPFIKDEIIECVNLYGV